MNDIGAKAVDGLMSFIELKKRWMSFYDKLGLIGLAETLDSENTFVDIVGLKEDRDLKDLSILFLPPIEVQKRFLGQVIKAIGISSNKVSFTNRIIKRWEFHKIWLSPWSVELNFSKIKFLNRPKGRPYLFLTENTKEVLGEKTLNRSAIDLQEEFKKQKRVGLNLFEYLIFHRDYVERHSLEGHSLGEKVSYPDECHSVWLLDSELPGLLGSRLSFLKIGKALMAESISDKQLKVWALPLDYNECNAQKARSGIVIPL